MDIDALYAEDVDLTDEEKCRILTTWIEVGKRPRSRIGHLEVFGLSEYAGSASIRSAFGAFVKQYHPDRFGTRRLGSFKAVLSEIAERANEARAALLTMAP